uniref:histone H2A deubiquitinase MYSM1-like n=1 Tax=Myxine glutinosa TaxID=7769 RepID=UPI00358E8000
MIISPFNRGKSAHSQFSCVTISEEHSPCGEFRLPYSLQLEIKLTASSMDGLLSTAQIIASKYEPLQSGTRMLQPCVTFPSLTHLQKMLLSMKMTLLSCTLPPVTTASILSKGIMREQCDPIKVTRNTEAMNGRVGGMDATEGCVPLRNEQNTVFLGRSEDEQHSGSVSNCEKAQMDETTTDVDALLCEVEKIFTLVYTAATSRKAS